MHHGGEQTKTTIMCLLSCEQTYLKLIMFVGFESAQQTLLVCDKVSKRCIAKSFQFQIFLVNTDEISLLLERFIEIFRIAFFKFTTI
jgi:hypothetical protein